MAFILNPNSNHNKQQNNDIHSFIHSFIPYISLQLLRGAPDYAIDTMSNTPKRYRQLRVKDLPKVPPWWLEWDSKPATLLTHGTEPTIEPSRPMTRNNNKI